MNIQGFKKLISEKNSDILYLKEQLEQVEERIKELEEQIEDIKRDL